MIKQYQWSLILVLVLLFSFLSSVVKAETVQFNLTWEVPTTRTDGTDLLLDEIAGYRIYTADTVDALSLEFDLNGNASNTYTLEYDITVPGIYTKYFAVTTYDVDGNESVYSNIVSKTVLVTANNPALPNSPKIQQLDINCVDGCNIHLDFGTITTP